MANSSDDFICIKSEFSKLYKFSECVVSDNYASKYVRFFAWGEVFFAVAFLFSSYVEGEFFRGEFSARLILCTLFVLFSVFLLLFFFSMVYEAFVFLFQKQEVSLSSFEDLEAVYRCIIRLSRLDRDVLRFFCEISEVEAKSKRSRVEFVTGPIGKIGFFPSIFAAILGVIVGFKGFGDGYVLVYVIFIVTALSLFYLFGISQTLPCLRIEYVAAALRQAEKIAMERNAERVNVSSSSVLRSVRFRKNKSTY